ncbi:MAG TPA: TetR/AcrR family transcriptional regulator [Acidimicrobiales bacterium]|nr:TetR/AcrR family transcriptional regulator [Acidimicrobiales bacterium]
MRSRRSVPLTPGRPARRDRPAGEVEPGSERDVRQAILDATEGLLADRRIAEVSVADVLAAARVSRASFYFYFEGKGAVLAELVRRAVAEGHDAAVAWVDRPDADDPAAGVRHGIAEGARLWRERAPLLRAVVETWRADDVVGDLWADLMGTYTSASAERIAQDRASGLAPDTGVEPFALASTLTWLGERIYYLAAIGVPPFDDEQVVVDVLTEVWMATVYGRPGEGAAHGSAM